MTPLMAQNGSNRRSAIDGRMTNHTNYGISQRIRSRIEEGFDRMKTIGKLRKTIYRGIEKTALQLYLHAAAYNSIRMKSLGLTCGEIPCPLHEKYALGCQSSNQP